MSGFELVNVHLDTLLVLSFSATTPSDFGNYLVARIEIYETKEIFRFNKGRFTRNDLLYVLLNTTNRIK
jgi:hypothetical protein